MEKYYKIRIDMDEKKTGGNQSSLLLYLKSESELSIERIEAVLYPSWEYGHWMVQEDDIKTSIEKITEEQYHKALKNRKNLDFKDVK